MNKTPKLRFKEFSGDWKQVKIGEVSKISGRIGFRGYTTADIVKKEYGALSLSPSNIVNSKLFLDKDNTYISMEKYEESPEIMVFNDDIVFVKTGSTFGKVALVENLNEKATLNPQLVVLKDIKMPPKLLSIIMSSSKIQRQVQGAKGGGVVPTLTQKELAEYKFYIPSEYKEQEQIASLFSLIDDKISLQSDKVEALKDYKKGMMQKIFSRELRFKDEDGRDYPEWEEKKLGDIAECLDNKRKPLNSTERGEMQGDIPYYGANGVVDFVNDYIFDEDIILLAEDGGNFDDFATRPIAQFVTGKSWVNNHAHVLRAKYNTEFLFYSLVHKDIRKYINGTSRAKLNKSDMLDILVNVPKSLEEQKKIADVLGVIYSKIEKEQYKLEYLNEYKKGLLQQMFV